MSKVFPETNLYVCRREHPTLGMLMKVGVSWNPIVRCKALGAELLALHIPYELEPEIHAALADARVWQQGDYDGWVWPLFKGHTEWFYWNEETVEILEAYEVYV